LIHFYKRSEDTSCPALRQENTQPRLFRRMKNSMLLVFCGLLGLSHAQFGGFSARQNCVGSRCNQNNFGRKRRQILEEILLEVEKEELSRVERDAQIAAQNCADSNCNQNNVASVPQQPVPFSIPVPQSVPVSIPVPQLVPGPIPVPQLVPGPIPVPDPVPLEIPVPQPVPFEIPVPQAVPMPVPVPTFPAAGFPFTSGFPLGVVPAPGFVSAVQNCQGSNCSQNNVGRKKREITEMIDSLTHEVLEAEAAEEARRKKREVIERILQLF